MVAHNDLKIANILLQNVPLQNRFNEHEDQCAPIKFGSLKVLVKIVDFGLATVPISCESWDKYPEIQRRGIVEDINSVAGTRIYYSPETVRSFFVFFVSFAFNM